MANTHSLDLELSSSQFAERADTASLSITGDFSIECWVKLEQLPSTATTIFSLVTKRESDTNESWIFNISTSDKLALIFSQDGTTGDRTNVGSDAAVVTAPDVGSWVHLAVTVDVSVPTVTLYKNGAAIASTAASADAVAMFDGNAAIRVGATDTTEVLFFDGKIDEIRIWDDIRSAGEISANYQTERQLKMKEYQKQLSHET